MAVVAKGWHYILLYILCFHHKGTDKYWNRYKHSWKMQALISDTLVSHWVIITSKENLLSLLPFKVFSKGWTFFNCMVALIVTKLKGIYIYLLFFIFKPGFYKHQSLQRIWCRLSKYIWKPYTVNHFKLTLKLSLKILTKSLLQSCYNSLCFYLFYCKLVLVYSLMW